MKWNETHPPWIWGALDGFLAIFTPCPYVCREALSWYLAHFLKLVLSEMGKRRINNLNYGLNSAIYEKGISQNWVFLKLQRKSKRKIVPFFGSWGGGGGNRMRWWLGLLLLLLLLVVVLVLMLLNGMCLIFGCSQRSERSQRREIGWWCDLRGEGRLRFGEEGLVKLMQVLYGISGFNGIWKREKHLELWLL